MRSTTHKSNLIQFSRASARLKANRRRRRCGVYRHLANIWSAQIRASSQIHIFLFWIDSRCLSRVSSLARSVQRATIMPQMCVFHFGWFFFFFFALARFHTYPNCAFENDVVNIHRLDFDQDIFAWNSLSSSLLAVCRSSTSPPKYKRTSKEWLFARRRRKNCTGGERRACKFNDVSVVRW